MHEVKLSLRGMGRSFECVNSEIIDGLDVLIWQRAAKLLKSRVYSHEGCTATISIDWSPVVQEVINNVARNFEYRDILAKKEEADSSSKRNAL